MNCGGIIDGPRPRGCPTCGSIRLAPLRSLRLRGSVLVGVGALLLLFSLWLGARLVSGWAAPLGPSGALHLQVIDGLLFVFALLGVVVGVRFLRRQTIPFLLFLGLLGLVGALFLAALSTTAALKDIPSPAGRRPAPATDSAR